MRATRTCRPRWALAVAAGLVVLVIAACGGGPSQPAGGAAGKGPVKGTIRYSWWGSGIRNQKTEAVNHLFEKKYPGVTVQAEIADFAPYWQKLTVQSAAHNLPCVPQMQTRYLSDYASRHVLMPLDDLVKSGAIDVSGIPRPVLDLGRGSDGKLYMIPTGLATFSIMYNATLVEQAGQADLPNGYTWGTYQNWLLQASRRLPSGVYAADLRGGQPSELFFGYVISHGQPVFKGRQLGFAKQLLIDWWQYWDKLRQDGATVSPSMMAEEPAGIQEGYLPQGKVMADARPANQFGAAQAPLTAAGKGTLKMVPYPSGPSGSGEVMVSSGLSIGANCDNVPAAAAFINFFANDADAARVYGSDNGVVSVTKLAEAQLNDPGTPASVQAQIRLYKTIIGSIPKAITYPSGYQAVVDLLARNYEAYVFRTRTMQQAVDSFFSESNAALQQAQS